MNQSPCAICGMHDGMHHGWCSEPKAPEWPRPIKTTNWDAALRLIRKHPTTPQGTRLARVVSADRAHFLLGYITARRGTGNFLRRFDFRG